MARKNFFILGTDTGVGKTVFTASLLRGLNDRGQATIGLKPVASGARLTSMGLRNDDALCLQKAASVFLPYEQVNPFCFAAPIAPHIAAAQEKVFLNISTIMQACALTLNYQTDYCFIEGVGGICVPLNKQETFADLVKAMGFPVILVVGMRVGCLNQALLTWKYLQQQNVPVIGWVANQIDPTMDCIEENINFLKYAFQAPYLGFFPHLQSFNLNSYACFLDYNTLLGILETKGI